MIKKLAVINILSITFIIQTTDLMGWSLCIINQTNKLTDKSTGQTINIVSYLSGDGENYINDKGGFHCTKNHKGKWGVGLSAQEWIVPPDYVIEKRDYTGHETNNNHDYIEVYCGQATYYTYNGATNRFESTVYNWRANWGSDYTCD